MPSIPEGWRSSPDEDPTLAKVEALLEGGGRLQATTLARVWLQKLARVGLREVDPSTGSPPKQPTSYYPFFIDPWQDDVRPARLGDSRQAFLLKLNGARSEQGYVIVEVC